MTSAEILLQGDGELKIRDLESLHGTLVNHLKLPANKQYPLKNGDVITIGSNITLGHQHYQAIVFQLQISERHHQTEVIDLSSPASSPKPAEPAVAVPGSPPVWAQARSGVSAFTTEITSPVKSSTSTNTFMVPDLDGSVGLSESEDSEADDEILRNQLSPTSENTSDVDDDLCPSDFSDPEVDEFEPLESTNRGDQSLSKVLEKEPVTLDDQTSKHIGADIPQLAQSAEEAYEKEGPYYAPATVEEDEENTENSPVFTPKTSYENSPASSPTDGAQKPPVQANPQPQRTNGFLSRILSDTDVAADWRQSQSLPPAEAATNGRLDGEQDRAAPAPLSQKNEVHARIRTPAPELQQENSLNILNSSPYYSCFSHPSSSQALPDTIGATGAINDCTVCRPSRQDPPPTLVPTRLAENNLRYAGPNSFGAASSSSSGRPVYNMPFSTWGPTPHEPHPFYPVHGVSDVPLSIPPWETPTGIARPQISAPIPPPPPPPVQPGFHYNAILNGQSSLPPAVSINAGQPLYPTINGEKPAEVMSKEPADPKTDLSRMAIPNIVSAASPSKDPVDKVIKEPYNTPIEPAVTKKRKLDNSQSEFDGDLDENEQYLELPEPFVLDTASTTGATSNLFPAATQTPVASGASDTDVEPPAKRPRMDVKQTHLRESSSVRRPHARKIARTAAKYTLAGAVGGVMALTGLLALPSSLFQ